ncbi:hypothetical protein SDC9_190558 [bioreactor metagenome]|uniref:Helix-turn-helix domain-containing protein n=1 Tax=bioreactor metagenome TaxID=1076179 RepID=A0A645HXT0_9ZZZZ
MAAELRVRIDEDFNDEFKQLLLIAAKQVVEEVASREVRAKDWMSIKDVQSYMGVSANTVSSWIKRGLPCSVVGQKRFISKNNLDIFLANHEK